MSAVREFRDGLGRLIHREVIRDTQAVAAVEPPALPVDPLTTAALTDDCKGCWHTAAFHTSTGCLYVEGYQQGESNLCDCTGWNKIPPPPPGAVRKPIRVRPYDLYRHRCDDCAEDAHGFTPCKDAAASRSAGIPMRWRTYEEQLRLDNIKFLAWAGGGTVFTSAYVALGVIFG